MYFQPISIGEVANIAEISKHGEIDFSVPQGWFDRNPGKKAVWFYGKRSKTFGRPLSYLTLLRLARRKCRNAYNLGSIQAGIDCLTKPTEATAA